MIHILQWAKYIPSEFLEEITTAVLFRKSWRNANDSGDAESCAAVTSKGVFFVFNDKVLIQTAETELKDCQEIHIYHQYFPKQIYFILLSSTKGLSVISEISTKITLSYPTATKVEIGDFKCFGTPQLKVYLQGEKEPLILTDLEHNETETSDGENQGVKDQCYKNLKNTCQKVYLNQQLIDQKGKLIVESVTRLKARLSYDQPVHDVSLVNVISTQNSQSYDTTLTEIVSVSVPVTKCIWQRVALRMWIIGIDVQNDGQSILFSPCLSLMQKTQNLEPLQYSVNVFELPQMLPNQTSEVKPNHTVTITACMHLPNFKTVNQYILQGTLSFQHKKDDGVVGSTDIDIGNIEMNFSDLDGKMDLLFDNDQVDKSVLSVISASMQRVPINIHSTSTRLGNFLSDVERKLKFSRFGDIFYYNYNTGRIIEELLNGILMIVSNNPGNDGQLQLLDVIICTKSVEQYVILLKTLYSILPSDAIIIPSNGTNKQEYKKDKVLRNEISVLEKGISNLLQNRKKRDLSGEFKDNKFVDVDKYSKFRSDLSCIELHTDRTMLK